MKIGSLAIRIARHHLSRHDHYLHQDWPKELYKRVRNVDALGDGVYAHQFSIMYAPESKRLGRTLIDIHGGAYVYSYRDNNYGFADFFAQRGYDVVLLDYPHNSKKQGCDEQVRVLGAQIAYLAKHFDELGLAKGGFGLIGDSAGGHFALLLTLASGSQAIQRQLGVDLADAKIIGVALSCPVYDFESEATSSRLSKSGKKMMFGPRFDDMDEIRRLSPKTYIEELKVPVYLNTCRNDFIGVHSQALFADLKRLGLQHTYRTFETDDKKVDHVHNVTKISLKESIQVNEEISAFFNELFENLA